MGNQPLPKITLRYNGLFDFDRIYSTLIDWAKTYGYMWHEKQYKHKVSGLGAEQEFIWELTKNINEFVNFKILIDVHGWDLVELEIEQNGQKKPMTSGRIYFVMKGDVSWDWQKKFSGNKFKELLGKWYDKMTTKDIAFYCDQLYYRMFNLHALFKKYFDMQTKKHPFKGYMNEN